MARVEDVASWEPLYHPDAKNEARVSPCGVHATANTSEMLSYA